VFGIWDLPIWDLLFGIYYLGFIIWDLLFGVGLCLYVIGFRPSPKRFLNSRLPNLSTFQLFLVYCLWFVVYGWFELGVFRVV
jgi:hypothetical protein